MKAVYFPGDRAVEVREVPDPQPGWGEARIRLKASAICRSDMSLYYGNPVVGGENAGSGTIVPGHEPCGVVDAVGMGVSQVRVGDRVAVYLAIGCGTCEYCKAGYRMFCSSWKCVGFDIDGGDADYMVVPAENCMHIPDEMSYEVGAVSTDAIGTLYHACKRLTLSGRDTVAIFGVGPMGTAGILVAKGCGARVIAVDLIESRLQLARELGADECVSAGQEDVVARLRELTGGRGIDAFIDCSGSTVSHNAALDALKPHGRGALIGESRESTIRPSDQFIRKQITVFGSWYFPIQEFEEITRFVIERSIAVDKLITHRFPIDDAATAFHMFDNKETEKVVFVWD